MKSIVSFAALAAGVLIASPLHAQNAERLEIIPFGGYMAFGDILRGPLGTSLSNGNGSVFGAQIGIPLAGPIAIYGSGSRATSDFTVGIPVLGGVGIGQTEAWMFDGGLELRAPGTRSLSPVVQAGAGAVHYRIDNPYLSTTSTNATIALGAGIDLAFTPNVGLRLMAKDYIGRFDFSDAIIVDVEGRTAHNVGLTAGLRIAF